MTVVSVYLNKEYKVKLQTIKNMLKLKTDSEAIRKAIDTLYKLITTSYIVTEG